MSSIPDESACPKEISHEFDHRVRANQEQLRAGSKPSYDFIVCGAGSSGSAVARRVADNPNTTVLLLEASGWDASAEVTNPLNWLSSIGSERDWSFRTRRNLYLNGRSLLWSMGKVLGGGSSINAMIWSRGHKGDWDHLAAKTGNEGWSYKKILPLHRRIEDWDGAPDPLRRGTAGLVYVQPASNPNPIAPAMLKAAQSLGIPTIADQNGAMMEGAGGAAITNLRICHGQRLLVFRDYTYPVMERPNLTVLTNTLVTRVILAGRRAVGFEVSLDGNTRQFTAGCEVILSLSAIQTPKVLMQSCVGDREELGRFGFPVVQHLAGVGRNLKGPRSRAPAHCRRVSPVSGAYR